MASENVFLKDISPRLGVNDVNALRKAEEFLRVLNNKCKIRNINDVAKTVLCLDLASTFVGISFDKVCTNKVNDVKFYMICITEKSSNFVRFK